MQPHRATRFLAEPAPVQEGAPQGLAAQSPYSRLSDAAAPPSPATTVPGVVGGEPGTEPADQTQNPEKVRHITTPLGAADIKGQTGAAVAGNKVDPVSGAKAPEGYEYIGDTGYIRQIGATGVPEFDPITGGMTIPQATTPVPGTAALKTQGIRPEDLLKATQDWAARNPLFAQQVADAVATGRITPEQAKNVLIGAGGVPVYADPSVTKGIDLSAQAVGGSVTKLPTATLGPNITPPEGIKQTYMGSPNQLIRNDTEDKVAVILTNGTVVYLDKGQTVKDLGSSTALGGADYKATQGVLDASKLQQPAPTQTQTQQTTTTQTDTSGLPDWMREGYKTLEVAKTKQPLKYGV